MEQAVQDLLVTAWTPTQSEEISVSLPQRSLYTHADSLKSAVFHRREKLRSPEEVEDVSEQLRKCKG